MYKKEQAKLGFDCLEKPKTFVVINEEKCANWVEDNCTK